MEKLSTNPPILSDTELLDWIAKNFKVVLHEVGDIRLEKLHPNEKAKNDRTRFRFALRKIIADYGL